MSTIGSYMTDFAITLWAWELTGQATALALINFFGKVPSLLILPFAGTIVDRCNRKLLIALSDAIAALSTLAILILYLTNHLQIWHFYATSAINSAFAEIQELAYSASITMMVPQQHYTRASSMGSMLHYGSSIFAPALAGILYKVTGLFGILSIDLLSFCVGIATVLLVHIPQPAIAQVDLQRPTTISAEAIFGFRYIFTRPNLLVLLVLTLLFCFAHDLGGALYSAMVLARSNNDVELLASLSAVAGIGGVVGALIITSWGGPKRRINGFLLGIIGAGASKTVFGLSQLPSIWLPAQFFSSLNFPLLWSSHDAIWLNQVRPEVQGRVFASQSLLLLVMSASAALIAGPLADRVFEPAMMSGGSLAGLFGVIFGTGAGAGMALLYAIASLTLLFIGLAGYALRVAIVARDRN